eukprot:TRINITY_DN1853_c0_g1_i1.p1 TRINITY_DN1853_c0_g1~~TRINITY_DN1853_c0_g1_i1.p1  ORF type:complete len:283 (-),score=79.68 TRINITY_DN1853_c0_g1_i1:379-1227(-)
MFTTCMRQAPSLARRRLLSSVIAKPSSAAQRLPTHLRLGAAGPFARHNMGALSLLGPAQANLWPASITMRQLSSDAKESQSQKQPPPPQGDGGDKNIFDDEPEGPRTTGQKMKEAAQMVLLLAILGVVGVCGYFVVQELFPGKLSPNGLFNRAFEAMQGEPDVANHFGTPLTAYGRDHGGTREGRRHFVEHEEYKAKEDGSKRMRIRFNVEGPYGHGFVFAEGSDKLPSGEWVYLMVQDSSTGHVITLQDNRALIYGRASATSDAEADALTNMLGGGKTGGR